MFLSRKNYLLNYLIYNRIRTSKMKFRYYNYECGNCEKIFKSPALIGYPEPYGEFLMRTEEGEIAYLYALDSKVFREFSGILKQNPSITGMPDMERSRILHKIFGWACDLSPSHSRYQISQKPVCPICKQSVIKTWGPAIPPEYVDLDIKYITHESWEKLSAEEKIAVVDNAVTPIIACKKLN